MDIREYEIIIEKIKLILQNKPLSSDDVIPHSLEVDRIQQALVYLSTSLMELNNFSGELCRGELESALPKRENYLAGSLKELHAVLKHLTWQTKQVASGDYKQRTEFLGDFSVAFNQMVEQLEERERMLKENVTIIEQSMNLLASIMDEHRDYIIVETVDEHRILYNNRPEEIDITHYTIEGLGIKEVPKEERDGNIAPVDSMIYYSNETKHYYAISSFPLTWEGEAVNVHYISDITRVQKAQKDLSDKAYKDQMTQVYNRRYCLMRIEELLEEQEPFTLVMVDLNNLKFVNDNYGHEEGDAYIKHCVKMMKDNTRGKDVVCRMGGDEFILLMLDCDEVTSHMRMDEIFQAIYGVHEKGYTTSISYGATHVDYKGEEYNTFNLIRESDAKMYEFKQEFKRNQNLGN